MRRASFLLGVVLMALGLSAFAETDIEGYNEATIRTSDFPGNAPGFEDFPAEVYSGDIARPDLQTHKRSRLYRTAIGRAARKKPNFAGHYILVKWSCGTSCTQIAIIDSKNGEVFHPKKYSYVDATNLHEEVLSPSNALFSWSKEGSLKFKSDSKLLIMIGAPEERAQERGISFLVWNDNKIKRIRLVKKLMR